MNGNGGMNGDLAKSRVISEFLFCLNFIFLSLKVVDFGIYTFGEGWHAANLP